MKQRLRLLLHASFVMLMLGITATPLLADLPQQRKALDELQAAKKADDPMPLLESAKTRITKANKGNKGGVIPPHSQAPMHVRGGCGARGGEGIS